MQFMRRGARNPLQGAQARRARDVVGKHVDISDRVSAIRPAGMERLVGPASLQQVIGYPGDVGLAAASCITSNLPVRRPDLRIAFSHGGGTLASLLPRPPVPAPSCISRARPPAGTAC